MNWYRGIRPGAILQGATLVLLSTLALPGGAWARPPVYGGAAPASGRRARPASVVRRLQPLRQNVVARAYVRGLVPTSAVRKALREDLRRREARFAPAWTPESMRGSASERRPRAVGPSAGAASGSGRRPEGAGSVGRGRTRWPAGSSWGVLPPGRRAPSLRENVGYPLPEWLRGIRLPDIGIRFSSRVYRLLAYYRTSRVGRSVLRKWLGRMHRFEGLIRAELRRHGLPQSLVFVALIESGFRPKTVSRAGAAGLWQFMPHGGRIYGLKRSFWVDERFNPDRATRAVMYYFKDLYRRFGSWELALAAYNAGCGSVTRAVQQFNTNDYYRLSEYEGGLPYETIGYITKFFAIAVVAANLDRFDLRVSEQAAPWEYALVTVRGSTSLRRVAQLAGVREDAIRALNPELLRSRVPPGPNYEVRIPPGSLATFQRAAAIVTAGTRSLRAYRVRYGESLASLARDLGVSASLLRRINHIRRRSEVRPGIVLLVPAGARRRPRTHQKTKRRLAAFPPMAPPGAGARVIYYSVVSGDRIPEIAKVLGVTVSDLLAWNGVTRRAPLLRGLVLRAVVPRGRVLRGVRLVDSSRLDIQQVNSSRFHQRRLRSRKRRRVVIRARSGDTLRKIARRFGVSAGSLERANLRSRRGRLRPGEPVVVYLRVGHRRRGASRRARRRARQGARRGRRHH